MILRLQESEIRLRQQLQSQQQENQHYRQQIQYRDRQSRPSTFLEHVYNCHSMLHSKLSIEPNPELRSKGTTTAIFSKAHPPQGEEEEDITAPELSGNLGHHLPDSICFLNGLDLAMRKIIFPIELKPPWRVTLKQLLEALVPTTNFGQASYPTAADTKIKHSVTQIYHYFVENSTGLGVLGTGFAFVFFKVNWKDPSVLYYHVGNSGRSD
ncbi:hypothetical protein E4U50_006585 [Claviceps purpurea]|nr:hypothetical protein E4U50_006585 [Claviceps purpurea]